MITATQLDHNKEHCFIDVENYKTNEMKELLQTFHASKKLSPSQIMVRIWKNIDEHQELLTHEINTESEISKTKFIIQMVAKFGKFKADDRKFTHGRFNGNKNTRQLRYTDCRQAGMYLTRKYTKLSFTQIGKLFFNKHYSSVIHADNKIKDLLKHHDTYITDMVDFVERKLSAANYIEK